jgi:predicted transcriptional regulator
MGRKSKINEQELLLLYGMGKTHQEIATELNVSRGAVTKKINSLKESNPNLFNVMSVDEFRNKEAHILSDLRRVICMQFMDRIKNGEKIPMTAMTNMIGTLIDKERLITDKSTSNVLHAHVIEGMSDKEKRLLAGDANDEALALLEIAKEDADVPDHG